MVTFPNCKINLGLNILEKRQDGFHNIETVFFPVSLNDALEIISTNEKTSFFNSGISTGSDADNLCLTAYYLLKKDFRQIPELKIHLHKVIPIGAGLGGGSANATFTLLVLNKKFNLNISREKLFEYALLLGSDCPFFLLNTPCLASGRGEILKQIKLSLSGYKLLLINPGIHINTREIFKKCVPAVPRKRIRDIIQQPISSWKNDLVNDFEKIVFAMYPQLSEMKKELYQHGAEYAAMTGTGSTLFGIFRSAENNFPMKKDFFYKWVSLNENSIEPLKLE